MIVLFVRANEGKRRGVGGWGASRGVHILDMPPFLAIPAN